MKKSILVVIFIMLSVVDRSFAQADSIKNYLMDALKIMQEKSVNKAKIDWNAVQHKALTGITGAKTLRDTYPVIKEALNALNDSHSNFYEPEKVKAYTLGYRATGQTFPVIKSELKANKYAYINLPDIGSFNNDDWNEYVNEFYRQVNLLHQQKPKGWIIDLRENFGGMLYPMYAAVAPFLDKANAVGIKDAEGKIEYFNYRNDKFYEGKKASQYFIIREKQPKRIKKPVAILVSKQTGSSAEFITAAFVGQKRVTIIGENTQGLTSGNQEYKLADGAFIALSIGNTVNREGKEYAKVGEGIVPNIMIKKSTDKNKINQAYLSAAYQYIEKK
ncbi:S41 family peptidase [Pedobacter aquatilis]|uniref:S41 family peptidase n=1 Tax=Pedobacter aquatilis TaxID=351343 RepID=UPI00292FC482|nr:S41 family peptidase [Pedobacter aquatilis]